MTSKSKSRKEILIEQVGVLTRWKNLGKTVVSPVPFVGEMIGQLEDHELDGRLNSIEAELAETAKLRKVQGDSKTQALPHDWSSAAAEYIHRTIDLAVVYDAGFHSRAKSGRELVQPVAHACLIGPDEIIAASEALELANEVADEKHGKLIVLAGMAWHSFQASPVDETSGLAVCKLTGRDEEKWQEWHRSMQKHGLEGMMGDPPRTAARHSVTPYVGQEVGFFHTGEASDVWRLPNQFSKRQFDSSVVSHFRRPRDGGFKTFVTGVLPGRILSSGSPVFSRDGTLLGIVADIESYPSDAGRRGVIKSLLGHPRFMQKPTSS